MTEFPMTPNDHLETQWCCLSCTAKFLARDIFVGFRLQCPHCRGEQIHMIGEAPKTLKTYTGFMGTKN